jgi:hypothetical protein
MHLVYTAGLLSGISLDAFRKSWMLQNIDKFFHYLCACP